MTSCKHDWHFVHGTSTLKCERCGAETGPTPPEQLAERMMQDVTTMGSAWSKDGERIDPLSVYRDTEPAFKFHEPRPTSITFFGMKDNTNIEVMRLSRDGVWVNPDIPTDEAAKKVLEVLDNNLKLMLEREREAGRQEAQEITWGVDWGRAGNKSCATIIKRLPGGRVEVVAVEYEP